MKLIYGIKDKPKTGQVVLFALQQLLAIMAATIAVPAVINSICGTALTASAALFGAGCGSIIYLLFTKSSSPVFLGSSFAFIGSMCSAFAGAASLAAGYWGLIIGALMAGLVYVVIAIVIKFCGVKWIDKLMPPVIIGPTVAIIGLSLSGNAVGDLMSSGAGGGSSYVALVCGLITLAVTMLASTYGKKGVKLVPFIIGILAGYIAATIFYLIGKSTNNPALIVISYSAFQDCGVFALPDFTFLLGKGGLSQINGAYIVTLFSAYVPVAFVVFAEHLADHKNLSSIVGVNLLEEARIMPQDSTPRSFAGVRLYTSSTFLPISASGSYQAWMPDTTWRCSSPTCNCRQRSLSDFFTGSQAVIFATRRSTFLKSSMEIRPSAGSSGFCSVAAASFLFAF